MSDNQNLTAPRPWHALEAAEVLSALSTSEGGLSDAEAAARLEQIGPNRLAETRKRHWVMRLMAQFNNVLLYVLMGAAVLTAFMGYWIDTWVIAAVIVINAAIGFIQEGRAESALEALRGMLAPKAQVVRDGAVRMISSTELVPGDVVALESGDMAPADMRLLNQKNLAVQEAALTGESHPVEKALAPVDEDAQPADRAPMVHAGTIVVRGRAMGVVVATAENTEVGKISTALGRVETPTTPLVENMRRFGVWLSLILLGVAAVLFVIAYGVQGMTLEESLIAMVAFAVATIPEGLPAIMTITLAIGVTRMAARKAIIRRLPAVETLGAITVICSDKTGTLTRNELTVRTVVTGRGAFEVTGAGGYAPLGGFRFDGSDIDATDQADLAAALATAALCNDGVLEKKGHEWDLIGDPTDGALLAAAMKGDLDLAALKKAQPRIEAIPFDSKLKYMATLNRNQDGEAFIHLKGAPEQVLDLCTRQCGEDGKSADLDRDYWSEKLDTMTARAERVIAVARRRVPAGTSSLTHDDIEKISSNGEGFVLLGLFGFIDPPREEAIAAVKHAHEAGIRVKMITGDHPATAIAIGKLLGLDTGEGAITGRDIETMDDAALRKAVTRTDIFARTTPDHKLRLVEALQAEGELVAMTGDGVNDAPALKTADIGVAMGDKGTEAAKEASGMVLADDNFATIAHAIEEGRTVFDNLRKAIVFVLPTSVAQGLAVMVAILFALTLPITPLQILWVNMITAVTLAIPLAFERPEANVMRRPPRPRGEGLLTPFLIWRIGFVSALLLAAIYIMFLNEYQPGIDEAVARTLAVNVLVMGEAVYLINSRHLLRPSWTWRGLTGNRYVLYGIAAVMAFQMIFTYWGPMQTLFGTAPLTLMHWGYVIGLALVVFVAVEIEKLVIRTAYRHSRQRGTRDTTLSAAEA